MNAKRHGVWTVLAAGMVGVFAAGPAAVAQVVPRDDDDERRGPAARREVLGGILERTRPQELTLTTDITVRLDPRTNPKTGMPVMDDGELKTAWDFTSAAVVFPVLAETSSSVPSLTWSGVLKGDDRVMDQATAEERKSDRVKSGYHSGTKLGLWKLLEWRGEEVSLTVTTPVTAYSVAVIEEEAKQLPWPSGWPAEAQSTFEPQAYIDLDPTRLHEGKPLAYEMEPVKKFVEGVTKGKDPKLAKPYVLAKLLAGQLVRNFNLSGDGLQFNRASQLEGIEVMGAPEAIRRGRGNEFDMVTALTAIYRQAGLPARMVIGWDTGKGDDGEFLGRGRGGELRPWVEFAMVGKDGKLVWIPVDIAELRKSSPRPPSLDREWKYFGKNDELAGVIPFSFHLHPPTTVIAHGAPAFWGWLVTPEPPKSNVMQSIRFTAISTPQRGGQDDRRRRRDRR